MADVLSLTVAWGLSTWAIFAIVGRDERRLGPDRRARAWLGTSKASAIVAFGPLALPVHFWRTRRTLAGTAVGLLWGAAVLAGSAAVETAIGWVGAGDRDAKPQTMSPAD